MDIFDHHHSGIDDCRNIGAVLEAVWAGAPLCTGKPKSSDDQCPAGGAAPDHAGPPIGSMLLPDAFTRTSAIAM